ncbi:MAG: Asp-tRNA(Asn)/Glu-tRNA(Gln) amidotransferase GatCAB subunit A, partial [Verrucomicrobia bacterium]|nr:Asp-tRNA(Asn)/Glu-tRNA(Gln) amidotransferase GatCAB subunit A [Verrucomicrobiota bacterium]
GRDPMDSTSLDAPVPDYAAAVRDFSIRGARIGLPKEYFVSGIDPQVEAAVRAAVAHYAKLGAEIVEVSLPHTEYAVAVYYIIATAEASANLARFDGVRYGHRAADTNGLLEHYGRTRAEGFGPEVKRRIILGTYVLSSGYYDAYYLRAQKVRTLMRQDFEKAFAQCDALICPTSPVPAFKLGERTADPLAMYLADIFTIAANLAGICGVSLPGGFAKAADDGDRELPIGVQLLGPAFAEEKLLGIAHAFEQTTDWHQRRPALG